MKDATERVAYQPSTGEAAASRAKFSEGWCAAIVGKCQPKQSKEKPDKEVSPRYHALNFQFKPLRDPEDDQSAVSRGLYKWQGLPLVPAHWEECFANAEDYTEETREDFEKWKSCVTGFFARGTYEVMAAVGEDVPPMPRFEDGTLYCGDEVLIDDTSEHDEEYVQDVFQKAKAAAINGAGSRAAEFYYSDEDPTELEGRVVYIYMKYKAGEREPNVERVRGEWPEENGRKVDLLTGKAILAGLRVEED